jgi:hypothetical protein
MNGYDKMGANFICVTSFAYVYVYGVNLSICNEAKNVGLLESSSAFRSRLINNFLFYSIDRMLASADLAG